MRMRALPVLASFALLTLAAGLSAESDPAVTGYTYNGVHRFALKDLLTKHGDKEWEIKPFFKHEGGHLGRYEVGDTISLYLSVGPVGLHGEDAYAQDKGFGRTASPQPWVVVNAEGKPGAKETRRFPFQSGAC